MRLKRNVATHGCTALKLRAWCYFISANSANMLLYLKESTDVDTKKSIKKGELLEQLTYRTCYACHPLAL